MTDHNTAKNVRAIAAQCVFSVVDKGRSLADELPKLQIQAGEKNKALLQEICYGVLRYLPELEFNVSQLMDKTLTGKQRVVHFLLLVGIYQIKYMRIPDHAAVTETVNACKPLKNLHLKGVVNAVLRNFQRSHNSNNNAENNTLPDAVAYNHPSWFIKKIKHAYPNDWQHVLLANQQRPPMWLRPNQQKQSSAHYLTRLEQAKIEVAATDENTGAIQLKSAIDVMQLPGFVAGDVSIQDAAAQYAAVLLDCQPNDNVLDCCAAPGGKTCHMLELCPSISQMTAIDIEQHRLVRVQENLDRLQLNAKILSADAAKPEQWWDKQLYDRILLDAPCSGTGVIRRHPDIKWLRKANDIDTLTQLQREIFSQIWPLLKPGGTMLYATCSVLPEENKQQIQWACEQFNDIVLQPIAFTDQAVGWQILPDKQGMDGFYYAKLMKKL
jgi:16S rRNA (cytosine967-C5)-methyltransferase